MSTDKMPNQNLLYEFVLNVKLIFRLLFDRRVNFFLKLLPVAGIAYMVLPDFVMGPLDDVFVIFFTFFAFLKLSPKEVVKEQEDKLRSVPKGRSRFGKNQEPDVIDADYKDSTAVASDIEQSDHKA
jgi:uncharacterized membrane protein YkvA (DUF1232 family)